MKRRSYIGILLTAVLILVLLLTALTGCGASFAITFDPANGQAATVVTVREGEVPTPPSDPVRDGYYFLGWYLGDVKYDGTAMIGDATLTARWSAHTYTVRFDTAGGTDAPDATVAHGSAVTAPDSVTRPGYDFLGWYLGDAAYDFATPVTGDLTLTAKWQVKTYTVRFDTAGGTDAPDATVAHGSAVTAPDGVTRPGYDFLGWYLGDAAYDFSTPVTGDLTLTAKWQIKTYTVRFDTAGGTDVPDATVAHGSAVTAPDSVTRPGYDFLGWYLGDAAYDFATPVTGDLTLTAKWQVKTYTVRFDTAGGTDAPDATVAHGSAVTAPDGVTRPGYDFLGWYLGDAAYDFSTPVTGDLTLTAKWQVRTFTVRFLDEDGTELKRETVAWGNAATAPDAPTAAEGMVFAGWDKDYMCVTEDLTVTATYGKKISVTFVDGEGNTLTVVYLAKGSCVTAPDGVTREGYDFLGWYLGDAAYDFATPVTGDLTLTAKWQVRTYTVTFDPAGGDARDPQTVEHGTAATKPEDPSRTYYRFGGWLLNGMPYDFTTPVTGDLTLKASWIAIRYRVTFDANGGSDVHDVLAEAGKPVEKPANPAKAGYRFGGWLDPDGSLWDFDTVITGEITLTAEWLDKTTAPEATVTGIYLDPGTVEMWEGMSLKLAMAPMEVTGDKGAFTKLTAAGITLRFVTLDPDVATVDKNGNITAVSQGETSVYAVYETGGTIHNGTEDVVVTAGDISNAVTVRIVEKPDYLKAYEADPENQQITLGNLTGKDVNRYRYYPTGDYGAANIATWYGNANTVFTLTADDNLMGDFAQWLAWYEAYGVTTTLFAPTPTYYECNDLWNQMVNSGLDVQSHSHFHRAASKYKGQTSTAQDWMDFYLGAQEIAATGIRSLIIAYPCGYNNAALSELLYIGGRGAGGYPNGFDVNYNQTSSYSGLNETQFAQLISAIGAGNGSWISTHYHQIGSSASDIDSMLSQLVPYIKARELWSATFAAASQYGQERDTATLTMGSIGRDAITFTLTDRMNDLLFDHALTIKIKVDGTWTAARAYQNGQEMKAEVVTDGGNTYLLVDAIPDRGEVTVVRTGLSGLTTGGDRIVFTPVEAGDGYADKTMTRRFYVSGDAWKNVYAAQGGRRIRAVAGHDGADLYVDVTFDVGGGEVVLVPTTDEIGAAGTYTMTDVWWGAVTPAAGNTVTVSSAEELCLFARWVNLDNDTAGLTFVLTDDIDLAGVTMAPIGWYVLCNKSSTLLFDRSFRGTFDGQGHTVSNLMIDHDGCSTGLFGAVNGGVIKNVKVKDAYISGVRQTGGLVGRLVGGTVNNCSFAGKVFSRGKGAQQYTGNDVGGLAGLVIGSNVTNCAVEAEISVFGAYNRGADDYANVYVNQYKVYTNGSYVGGAIGRTGDAASVIRNVSFNGKVTVVCDREGNGSAVGGFIGGGVYATVTDCSATAVVSGHESVGGFVGSHEGTNQSLAIRNCVANGSVYGSDKVGGFAGYMGYNGRASSANCFTNVRVTYKEGAAFVGAVIGQAYAGSQTPSMKKMYYLPTLNPGLATHTPFKDDKADVNVEILEAADAEAAMAALNALAEKSGDQSWILAGDTVTPVHYPIFRVVFLDKDGGELAAFDVPNGMGVTAPSAPEYLGFRFIGWSADTSNVTGDMVVSAQYEAIETHTVIFLDKDGGELWRTTVNHGEGVTPPAAPGYEGFRFTGWSASTASVTSDITVTAQYEVVLIHTVTFVERDGVTAIGEPQRVNDGTGATAPAAPAVEGYVFVGWSVDFSEVHGDLTVVAQYAKLYTVRFYGYNGVLLSTVTVQDGKAATAPGAPAVEGYRFTGWAEDFSNVTADLDVHANYAVKSTDPITVEIKNVYANGGFKNNLSKYLDGDIVIYDGQKLKINNIPASFLTKWGFVSEQGMSGTNTGGGYGIFYNLERYELASGMTPYTLCGTDEFNNAPPYQENYKVISAFGNGFQVLAVPLFDKAAQRNVVVTFVYQGPWIGTTEAKLKELFKITWEELTAFYPDADMFVTAMHCVTNDKNGGNKGLADRLTTLDDTTPFVDGWNMTCLNEIAQVDGNSTFYTLVCTRAGEVGSVTVDAATVPAETNIISGGYTVTVRVGKSEE